MLDTKDDPRTPRIIKEIAAEELAAKAGLLPAAHHPLRAGRHLRLGARRRHGDGPGGIAVLDHTTFEVRGQWENDRGDQYLAYDFWWHLTRDVLVSSEWGTPSMIEDGLVRSCCWAASTGTACTSGTSPSATSPRPSTSATSTR